MSEQFCEMSDQLLFWSDIFAGQVHFLSHALLWEAASQRKDFCLAQTVSVSEADTQSLLPSPGSNVLHRTEVAWSGCLHIQQSIFTWSGSCLDSEFWKSVMCHLHSYFSAILPELVVPYLQKGGIREPSEWLHDPDSWETHRYLVVALLLWTPSPALVIIYQWILHCSYFIMDIRVQESSMIC